MTKKLLIDYTTFQITPKMIKESEERNGGKVVVQGVLQRSGAKNQNGRVYPKDILAREVENYKKVQIAERRALGELDHPESSVVNEWEQCDKYCKTNSIIRDILGDL